MGQPRRIALVRASSPAGGPSPTRPSSDAGPRRPISELIIGRHPISEALRAGRPIHRIMLAEEAHGGGAEEVVRLAAEHNVAVQRVSRTRLDEITDHHQGLIADAAPYRYADLDQLLAAIAESASEHSPLVLAVDSIQDPQNLGTLLRTALAVGVIGVILPERRNVAVTSAVGRASAGAIERLRIAQVTNLVRTLKALQAAGLWIVGLDAAATQRYDEADLSVPLAVVVGSEGSGLGRLVTETCDLTVSLPMLGGLDSLNAAVAGSIVLYEARRQQGQWR